MAQYEVLIKGTNAEYPKRNEAFRQPDGIIIVKWSGVTKRMTVVRQSEEIGYIDPSDASGSVLEEAFEEDALLELTGQLTGREGRYLTARVGWERNTEISTDSQPYSQTKELSTLLEMGVFTEDEWEERRAFLTKYGINEKVQAAIFSSAKTYPGYEHLVPSRLETAYHDTRTDGRGLLARAIEYVILGRNVLLKGEKGTGKNVLTETLAWLFKRPLFEVSLNSQQDNQSLLGAQTLKEGEIVFSPEVILQAAEVGGFLVLDEINTALPHVMSTLNSLLDDRRRIQVAGYGLVRADATFVVIGTMNIGYQGTFPTNEATADRFVPLLFPPAMGIADVVKKKVPGAPSSVVARAQQTYEQIKMIVKEGQVSDRALSIRGFIYAVEAATLGTVTLRDALVDNLAYRVEDEAEQEALIRMVEMVVGE